MQKGSPEVIDLKESNVLSEPLTIGDNLDLRWVQREEIAKIEDRKFTSISKTGNFHGLAIWFDVTFEPLFFEDEYEVPWCKVELKTGPGAPPTHWKQTVLVITENFASGEVEEDEIVGWDLGMEQSAANPRQYSLSLALLDPESEARLNILQIKIIEYKIYIGILNRKHQPIFLTNLRQNIETR